MTHEEIMNIALSQAKKAKAKQEVPIGAVVVKNGKVIAKAYNKRNKSQMATHHAEVLAINKACKKLHSWRLDDCDLYVTLMPCPMCAGAIKNARIKTLIVGANSDDEQNKLCESIICSTVLNHKTNVVLGVCKQQCSSLLTEFFKSKRKSS